MTDNGRVDPEGINPDSRLRASDADRDHAASLINQALAEGRLTPAEHSDRLDAVYAARTQADLVPLLGDLPQRLAAELAIGATAATPAGRASTIIAVLSGATRKGAWHADPVIDVVTVLGSAELDFRAAVLTGSEVRIRAVNILGALQVTVPPEMRVVDSGIAIFGGRDISGGDVSSLDPRAPVLRISGICLFGGVEVRQKERKRGQGQLPRPGP